jgi:hypothetical protein
MAAALLIVARALRACGLRLDQDDRAALMVAEGCWSAVGLSTPWAGVGLPFRAEIPPSDRGELNFGKSRLTMPGMTSPLRMVREADGRPTPIAPSRRLVTTESPIVDLQRRAGNGAVARLFASGPSSTIIQRDQGPSNPAAEAFERISNGRRLGEAWPYGPTSKRKSATHDLATFVDWIGVVEMAYGPNKEAILQRLRRLYYSSYSGKAGANFDRVIEDQAGAEGPPLDWRPIGAATLDGLFETDSIQLPSGETVDVAHILAALDIGVSGVTWKADVGAAVYDAPWTGVATWTGDLASWFVEWSQQIRKAINTPPPPETGPATEAGPASEQGPGPFSDEPMFERIGASKASKSDLLGDMDAVILAATSVQRSTVESIKAEDRPVIHANVARELTMPVSKLVGRYYGLGSAQHRPAESAGRFPQFVKAAVPRLPYREIQRATGTKGSLELESGAYEAILDAIRNTAELFITEGTSDRSDPIHAYEFRLRQIAQRFTRFLEIGLKSGDAPWP